MNTNSTPTLEWPSASDSPEEAEAKIEALYRRMEAIAEMEDDSSSRDGRFWSCDPPEFSKYKPGRTVKGRQIA